MSKRRWLERVMGDIKEKGIYIYIYIYVGEEVYDPATWMRASS